MFGCFRKGDANDPDIYVAACAAILSEYPESVIDFVTDPRTGLPRKSKWLPQPAEVADACEEQMAPMREAEARRQRIARQFAERESPSDAPVTRERIKGGFEQLTVKLRTIINDEATGEKLPPASEGEERVA